MIYLERATPSLPMSVLNHNSAAPGNNPVHQTQPPVDSRSAMAKEDARNRTYFVAPGWDLHANAATLGSVITHPTQPQLSIFTPGPEDLGSNVQTTETASFLGEPAFHKQGETRLFGTFIDLYGLGAEATLQYDRHAVLSYSIEGM